MQIFLLLLPFFFIAVAFVNTVVAAIDVVLFVVVIIVAVYTEYSTFSLHSHTDSLINVSISTSRHPIVYTSLRALEHLLTKGPSNICWG